MLYSHILDFIVFLQIFSPARSSFFQVGWVCRQAREFSNVDSVQFPSKVYLNFNFRLRKMLISNLAGADYQKESVSFKAGEMNSRVWAVLSELSYMYL